MKLLNSEIFEYTNCLIEQLYNTDIYIPVKANFYIQKNVNILIKMKDEIEQARLKIAAHYGTLDSECNQYIIPAEHIAIVNNEINDLFAIEQEIELTKINIEDLGDIELTPKQMQALMFMIEE